MKTNIKFLIVILVALCTSCESTKIDQQILESKTEKTTDIDLEKGFRLLESNCFTCHSPNEQEEKRYAPTMASIKKQYLLENSSKVEFVKATINYIISPSEETSTMKGSIEKYGIMPKMKFSEWQLNQIAEYIYNTEIEEQGWFDEKYPNEKKKYINN